MGYMFILINILKVAETGAHHTKRGRKRVVKSLPQKLLWKFILTDPHTPTYTRLQSDSRHDGPSRPLNPHIVRSSNRA